MTPATEWDADVDQRGQDGAVAARTYVGAGVEVSAVVADPSLTPLVVQRDELEAAVAEIQARKEDDGRRGVLRRAGALVGRPRQGVERKFAAA